MSNVKNATAKAVKTAPVIAAETTPEEPAQVESLLIRMDNEKNVSLSLEDRLHRLNVLFDLQKKYNSLQNSLYKLKQFKLTHDGQTAYLSFRDEDRKEFSTQNPEVMQDFLEFLKTTIESKIKAIEPLLTW